jgi:protein ImuB
MRVASLYLPNLATDRLRRIDGTATGTQLERVSVRAALVEDCEPEPGTRIEDCSCPRGGGWRPGASWARREELQAEIDALPAHQRPRIQELGRRTEPAEMPFKKSSPPRGAGPQKAVVEGAVRQVQNPLHRISRGLPPRPGEDLPPIVTTHRVGNRIEVAAASPEAQALGIHPGMPLTQARVLVSSLDVRDADHEADHALLIRLGLFAARRWTPTAALSGPDGLWLDLTGVTHLFGGERLMCERILRFCARLGLSARIAVAGTPGGAHALARHAPDEITLCPSGREAQAIAPLPIAALRIEPEVVSAAHRLGLDRIGDLIAMPRGPLNRRFGKALLTRLDQALGWAAEPFDPIVPTDPPSVCHRFAEPIATAEAIAEALGRLMADFIAALEKEGLASKRTLLLCARIDGTEQRIAVGTARATRDSKHLLRLIGMKIETIDPGFGIEAMRLVADRSEPLAPQSIDSALGGEKPAPDLVPLIDRLAGRLGPRRIYRTTAVESDVPERSLRRVSPLGEAAGWPLRWPRPSRLLSRPERVEKVMAELPDQAPVRFQWRGRMHRVRRADGPERIYGEWWKKSGEADAVRDYFQVEDEEGARFWLYRRGDGVDTRTGDLSWWLQGMFG